MRKRLPVLLSTVLSLSLILIGSASAKEDTSKLGLVKKGSLVVGMTLQFPPQMYLNSRGEPAGYDYELLKRAARDLGLKLEIKNMDFSGLIPGLVAKQFDLVSVGLGKNPDREKSILYVREYMPYSTILISRKGDKTGATIAAWNVAGKKITALQGSLAATAVKTNMPKATLVEFPQQDAAFLEVVSGRADAIIAEANLYGFFNKNNPGLLTQVKLAKNIRDYYGHWTVQLGNDSLKLRLADWLCDKQESGLLKAVFQQQMGYKQPALPKC